MKKIQIEFVLLIAILAALCSPLNADDKSVESNGNNQNMERAQLSVELKGTDLFNAIVSEVTSKVDQKISERESKRWAFIGTIAAVSIAFLGFIGFRDLRRRVSVDVREELRTGNLLMQLVETSVKENITRDVSQQLVKIEDEFFYYRLANLATDLKNREGGFTKTERDAAFSSLRRLSEREEIISREDFAVTLETIIDKFASANLSNELDELESIMSEVILRTQGIVMTFVQFYGLRAIGEIEADEELIDRFKKYTAASRRHDAYELALPYLLVFEFTANTISSHENIEGYLLDMAQLDPKEKETVQEVFSTIVDPANVSRIPSGDVLRFTARSRAFYEKYDERINEALNNQTEIL